MSMRTRTVDVAFDRFVAAVVVAAVEVAFGVRDLQVFWQLQIELRILLNSFCFKLNDHI
jgi:hypothetical protein